MITPLPGAIPTKPGSATLTVFRNTPVMVTASPTPLLEGSGGQLAIYY